jgi:transcriptional regulator with XRE-family HTH domain
MTKITLWVCCFVVHLRCTLQEVNRKISTLQLEFIAVATFGEWLYQHRKAAGLSQDDLADQADCSKNYISRLERDLPHGVTGAPPQPSRKIVEALGVALGVPAIEALRAAGYASDPDFDPNTDEPTIIAYYNGLDRDDQDELLAIAKLKWERRRREETTHGKKAE